MTNPPLNKSSGEQLLQLGQEAFLYTVGKIKASSNQIANTEINTPDSEEIFKKINQMRAKDILSPIYSREWIAEVAIAAEAYAVGNCCEKACVVFNFLFNQLVTMDIAPSIELFNNPFDDHFFVVIGRPKYTNPADPSEWGKKVVVCDVWAEQECYTIGDIDFNNLSECKYQVIKDLISKHNGMLSLQRDILAKANGSKAKNAIIISQDTMVLRFRADFDLKQFVVHNSNVAMTYEAWDFPQEKHYVKQRQLTPVPLNIAAYFQPATSSEFPDETVAKDFSLFH